MECVYIAIVRQVSQVLSILIWGVPGVAIKFLAPIDW